MCSYRGVEQLAARRAHNPEVGGSSPSSATIKTTVFNSKTVVFLTFRHNLQHPQNRHGEDLGKVPSAIHFDKFRLSSISGLFPTFLPKISSDFPILKLGQLREIVSQNNRISPSPSPGLFCYVIKSIHFNCLIGCRQACMM